LLTGPAFRPGPRSKHHGCTTPHRAGGALHFAPCHAPESERPESNTFALKIDTNEINGLPGAEIRC